MNPFRYVVGYRPDAIAAKPDIALSEYVGTARGVSCATVCSVSKAHARLEIGRVMPL